jgi:hypothetical protein
MNRYFNNYKLHDLYEIRDLIESNIKKTGALQKKLNKLNLEIVAEGGRRIVLENPNHNCVIKIQKRSSKYEEIKDDFYENKFEVKSYNRLRGTDAEAVFAPIIDFTDDFNIISQLKVDTKNVSNKDMLKVAGLLIYKYSLYVEDLQIRNIGKYKNNNLCIIDYGAGVKSIENSLFDSNHDAFKGILDRIINNKNNL